MDRKITLFHGSRTIVEHPDISYSRIDIDFGPGFYTTLDRQMACKWACNKQRSVINEYNCDLMSLNIMHFKADKIWLDYVIANREGKTTTEYDQYDAIVGPTADDKMFNIIDMYNDGLISVDNAILILNNMNYAEQIVFKSQDALDEKVLFSGYKELDGPEKQHYIDLFRQDRKTAEEKTVEMLKRINMR